MAELSKLTIDLTFNDKGLHEFEDEGTRVAQSLNKSYSDLDGTFVMLSKDISEFQQALNKLNGNKLTLNSSLIHVASTIGESYDLSVRFGQSLDDVVKKLKNVKPIIEEANDSLEDTSSKFPDFGPLLSLLTEVAKFYRSSESFIKIFITFFDVFRVFADVAIREFGSKLTALFITIKDSLKTGFNQFLGFLDRVKEFGKLKIDQFSEFINQLKEAGKLKFDQISNSLKSFTDNVVKFAGEVFKKSAVIRQLIALFERLSTLRIPPQIAIALGIAAAIPTIILLIKHWEHLDEIIGMIPETIDKVNKEIDRLIQTSIAFISGVITKVSNTISGVWEGAKEKASEAWEGIKGVVSEAVETIKGYYGGISESLSEVWQSAKETTSNAWDSIEQRVSNGVQAIKEKWGDIKESVDKAFEDVFGGTEVPPAQLKPQPRDELRLIINPDLDEDLKKQKEEIERTNKVIDDQTKLFPPLSNALAMAGGEVSAFTLGQGYMSDATNGVLASVVSLREKGIEPLGGQTDEIADRIETASGQVEQAEGKFNTYGISLGDVNALNKVFGVTQDQVNQSLDDGTVAFDSAGASAEEFGDTLDQVQTSGGFFDGIKQGFKDFVTNVESNSELMADFFANTLSQMSQSFSDLFFNVLTGKFDDLADLAKQAFEAILRAFLDLVSAIATRQIVISIAGLFGVDTKGASAGDVLGIGKQAAGIGLDLAGVFGGGSGAAAGSAAVAGGATSIGTGTVAIGSGLGGISSVGTGAAAVGTTSVLDVSAAGGALGGINAVVPETGGFLASIGGVTGAITIVGAVLAAAALAFTFLAPLFKKTPRLDIDFDSVKTEAGRRAALVSELLDDDFLKDEIIDISVKRKAGLGLGGDEGIKDVLADAIQDAVNNLLDIINKLPTDLADTLTDELLNTPLDTETEVAGERLFEFDAKGKKISEKFNQLINGEIQAKFLFAVDGFLQTMFESLGVLPEAAESFLDKKFEEFKNAGSREARAKVGQELLADINAFVDAFNIVSGNVNDAIGQTIQKEEWEYRLAA